MRVISKLICVLYRQYTIQYEIIMKIDAYGLFCGFWSLVMSIYQVESINQQFSHLKYNLLSGITIIMKQWNTFIESTAFNPHLSFKKKSENSVENLKKNCFFLLNHVKNCLFCSSIHYRMNSCNTIFRKCSLILKRFFQSIYFLFF